MKAVVSHGVADVGDRVVIPSTIACGTCSYCRAGYDARCDVAYPNGPGTASFGREQGWLEVQLEPAA
jgi:threonine dehydrogenase-like Zn-dependent dehydrogenase